MKIICSNQIKYGISLLDIFKRDSLAFAKFVSNCFESVRHPVVSDSLRPHRLQPVRALCPWDSLGKNTVFELTFKFNLCSNLTCNENFF